MSRAAQDVVRRVSFYAPACVFLVAGAGKLVDPSGVMPRSLEAVSSILPPAAWLRMLGVVELALAVALVVPRCQKAAAHVGFVLLLAFSALLALNAHDEAFVRDCGCLGALPATGVGAGLGGFTFGALRNASLCFLLAVGAYLKEPGARPLRDSLSHAGMIAAVVLLGTLYVGERERGGYARERSRAQEQGLARSLRVGWILPDFELLAPDGRATRSGEVLRADDHLVFFKPSCDYCARTAHLLPPLDERLRAGGGRVVLISVGEADDVAAYVEAHGCAALAHYVATSPFLLQELGLQGVPQVLVLDPERRVLFSEGRGRGSTFADALIVCGTTIAGFEPGAWNQVASRLFGAGCEIAGEMPRQGLVREVAVRGPDDQPRRLSVLQSRRAPAHYVEIALAIQSEDVVVDLMVLATGDHARVVVGGPPDVGFLRGRTVAACREAVGQRAAGAGLDAPFWRELADVLGQYVIWREGGGKARVR